MWQALGNTMYLKNLLGGLGIVALAVVVGFYLFRSEAEKERIRQPIVTDADLEEALSASTSPLKPGDLASLKAFAAEAAASEPAVLPTVADLAAEAVAETRPALS